MPGVCRHHGEFPGERCPVIGRRGPCKSPPNRAPAIANENPLGSLAVSLVAEGRLATHRLNKEELLGILGGGVVALHRMALANEGDLIQAMRAAAYVAGLVARLEGWVAAASPESRGEPQFTTSYLKGPRPGALES